MNDTMTREFTVRRLSPAEIRDRADELADVLLDATDAGAVFAVRQPLRPLDAVGWTLDVADEGRRRIVFAAEADERLLGIAQLVPAGLRGQPHRAEVLKLVVRRAARGRGIGRALLSAVETAARDVGVPLLTMETTAEAGAMQLCEAMGWRAAGTIPGYGLSPEGRPIDSRFIYKQLVGAEAEGAAGG